MANKIKDSFNNLKTKLVGTKTTKIDTRLDKAINDIISYKSNSGRNGVIDLVNHLIAKQGSINLTGSQFGGLFGNSPATPSALGQSGRLHRYKVYDSIVSTINYCHRALNVLTDNILAPDDITKECLEIYEEEYFGENDPQSKINETKEIIKKLKLEKYLNQIIKNTLQFGDYFCEIADSKTAILSKSSMLNESIDKSNIDSFNIKLKENENINLKIDYSAFNESSDVDIDLKDIKLLFYEPKRVVKLQSEMFPLCFGYLIFPSVNIDANFNPEQMAINNICVSILKNLENKIPQIKELNSNNDLKDVISTMIKTNGITNSMQIRFIPPDKMQHFLCPGHKYRPYGESIFDSCQYTGKVLIALETALAVQRLSRSTEKRKILVELGLPRDAKSMVDQIKTEFNKRKISLDEFGTVDSIPSTITTFEDVYIPQKDGKPFVDIQTMTEGNVDIRSKVDELKFLRDQLVASLGIPSSFLNIEENLSNKAALSEENILFARTIISHQKYLTDQLNDLLKKVYKITDPENEMLMSERIIVKLPPPKSLQYERQARYTSELANLIRTLEEIGVPKEWAKRKFLTNIDWDDVEKFEITEKIEKGIGVEKDENDMGGGMMGGF